MLAAASRITGRNSSSICLRLVELARAPIFIAAITRPVAFWIGIASVRRSISSSWSTRHYWLRLTFSRTLRSASASVMV